jgi:hypothetical protein
MIWLARYEKERQIERDIEPLASLQIEQIRRGIALDRTQRHFKG